MQHIEIEYNQELKPLEAVVSGVKQPGDFFVSGAIEIPMPRVEVEGAGTLSFPVPAVQIAEIVHRAERAPYGRGEETIVYTSVRNVWQIASEKVKKILGCELRDHPFESEGRPGMGQRKRLRRAL